MFLASLIAQWCYLKAISLRWQHKNKGNAKVASQKKIEYMLTSDFFVALVNIETSLDRLCCDIFVKNVFYGNVIALYLLNLSFVSFSLQLLVSFYSANWHCPLNQR